MRGVVLSVIPRYWPVWPASPRSARSFACLGATGLPTALGSPKYVGWLAIALWECPKHGRSTQMALCAHSSLSCPSSSNVILGFYSLANNALVFRGACHVCFSLCSLPKLAIGIFAGSSSHIRDAPMDDSPLLCLVPVFFVGACCVPLR